MLLRKKQH